MKRTLYFLDDKTQRNFKDKFLVLDIETNGLQATPDKFLFCCLYGNNFKKTFFTIEDIKKELLCRQYRGKIIFAHNAEYDLTGIYGNILKFLDKEAIFNGKFICATNGNVTFADSHNIIQGSVKDIGNIIGIKKTMVYTKVSGKHKKVKITQKEIDGCFRDCEIIYVALLKIFEELGEIKITIGSLAMNYFRRKFMNESLTYDDKYDNEFFKSYYGGRVEAFLLGRVNAYKYDVNSMYPFCMKDIVLPNPNFFVKKKITIKKFLNKELNCKEDIFEDFKEGLISAEVIHKKSNFGFLPMRTEDEVFYPIGKLKGVWNLNEFRFALENNIIEIKKIDYIIYSTKVLKNFFTDFVTTVYKKRLNAKTPLEKVIWKNVLNNLYGKFGTKTKPKTIFIENIEDEKTQMLFEKLELKGTDYKLIKTGKHYLCEIYYNHKEQFSIPMIASYITSAARIELLKLFIKYESYGLCYTDTDCIAVKKKLPIKTSLELGNLKLEKERLITIKGNKHYTELKDGKITLKLKGVPKKHTFDGEKYHYKKMIKTKEGLKSRKHETGMFKKVEKVLSKEYSKRINNKPIVLK